MVKAKVSATGRVGQVVAWDPDDQTLTFKMRFSDGQKPEVEWLSRACVEDMESDAVLPLFRGPGPEVDAARALNVNITSALTGTRLCELHADGTWRVFQLKDAIEASVGVHVLDQRLIAGVCELQETEILCEKLASEIHMGSVSVSLMQMESAKGDCPSCRRVDMEHGEDFVSDKRGVWWEKYRMCPYCNHRQRLVPSL